MFEHSDDSSTNPDSADNVRPEQAPGSRLRDDENASNGFAVMPHTDSDSQGRENPAPTAQAGSAPTGLPAEKSRKKLVIAGVAGLAGVVILAGSAIGINAGAVTSQKSTLAVTPKAISQTPVETPSTEAPTPAPNLADLVAAQEIKSGQTTEALAQDINTKLSNWMMAGTDSFPTDYVAKVSNTGDASDATFINFANDYAKKQFTEIYGPALFGIKAGDIVNPKLQLAIDTQIAVNSDNLLLFYITSDQLKPYTRGLVKYASNVTHKDDVSIEIALYATDTSTAIETKSHVNDRLAISDQRIFVVSMQHNGATEVVRDLFSRRL